MPGGRPRWSPARSSWRRPRSSTGSAPPRRRGARPHHQGRRSRGRRHRQSRAAAPLDPTILRVTRPRHDGSMLEGSGFSDVSLELVGAVGGHRRCSSRGPGVGVRRGPVCGDGDVGGGAAGRRRPAGAGGGRGRRPRRVQPRRRAVHGAVARPRSRPGRGDGQAAGQGRQRPVSPPRRRPPGTGRRSHLVGPRPGAGRSGEPPCHRPGRRPAGRAGGAGGAVRVRAVAPRGHRRRGPVGPRRRLRPRRGPGAEPAAGRTGAGRRRRRVRLVDR